MRLIAIPVFILIILINQASFAQNALTADKLEFKSVFGTKKDQPDIMYCILGQGFFRAIRTKNSDSIISSWIKNHPHAQVTKVSAMSPIMQNGTGTSIYIWLIDGKENLNIYLIRQGVFTAGVMHDAVDFSKKMKVVAKEIPLTKTHTKRLVSDSLYNDFLNKIEDAEKLAKAEKKGIWSDEYKEEREEEDLQ